MSVLLVGACSDGPDASRDDPRATENAGRTGLQPHRGPFVVGRDPSVGTIPFIPVPTQGPRVDPSGTVRVTLRFSARLGSQTFACGQAVAGIGSSHVTAEPVDFRFFVQDVKFLDARGEAVPLTVDDRPPWQYANIALIDFEDGTGQCREGDPGLNTEITGTLPEGTYRGVELSNGVPEVLNHSNPVWAPPPLGFGALHVGGTLGYRFIKLELAVTSDRGDRAELDAGGPAGGVFHLGSAACQRVEEDAGTQSDVACDKPNRNRVRFQDYDPNTNVIVAHADAVFAQSDLNNSVACERQGAECAPMFESAGVNPRDGEPRVEQTLYTVE